MSRSTPPDASALARRLGVEGSDQALFLQALTHKSYAHEMGLAGLDNERLEFLGDSVLELVVREYLYVTFPESSEGEMARMRAAVVCAESLAAVGTRLALGNYLRLGRGEEQSGGRRRRSLIGNAFEAIVGVIFLQQGWEKAKRFVLRALGPELAALTESRLPIDPKSELQERLQADAKEPPSYRLVEQSGPDHQRQFVAEVVVDGEVVGRGEGASRRRAEQAAAAAALSVLFPGD